MTRTKTGTSEEICTNYVQNFLGIRDIDMGMLITEAGKYVKVLEFSPVNFMAKNGAEQDQTIHNFASFLKVCPVRGHYKVVTSPADADKYIRYISECQRIEPNLKTKAMTEYYKRSVYNIGKQGAVNRSFYFIFEYEPKSEMYRLTEKEKIAAEMQKTANQIKGYFSRVGNDPIEHRNEDYFLAEFLYNYLNPKSSVYEPFSARSARISKNLKSVAEIEDFGHNCHLPISYYIAPRGIDFSTSPSFMMIDGMYQSHLYTTSAGWPVTVCGGWLSSLVTAGNGINVDLFTQRLPKQMFLTTVSRKTLLSSTDASDKYESQKDYEETMSGIKSGMYLKRAVGQGGEDPFYIVMLITITSPTLQEHIYTKQAVIDAVRASAGMELKECKHMEPFAFQSVLPCMNLDSYIFKKAKRNAATNGVASCYPFTAFELCDEKGIVIGTNRDNASPCALDLYDTKKYKNANMAIFGTTGAGKTYTLGLLSGRLRMLGTQCFMLLPEKAHELKRLCTELGGSYIKIAASSKDKINIMDIRIPVAPLKELIDGYTEDSESLLVKKSEQLLIFFSLLLDNMTEVEENLIDEEIINTYSLAGITTDNNSLYSDKENGLLKPMPILEDLYLNIKKNKNIPERVHLVLQRFVTGSAQCFNGYTNVDLDNKYIAFDLEDLKGKLLAPGMFIALDCVWDKVKEDRTKKKAIIIDEAWKLLGAGANIKAAEYVQLIFKVIRGYGGSAIMATQQILDLFALDGGKFGATILSCSKTKLVLNMEKEEAMKLREHINLTKSETLEITGYKTGEALVCVNNTHIPIKIIGSPEEHRLITTDRGELAIIAENKRKQKKELHNRKEETSQ